jgi:hypothetical protein
VATHDRTPTGEGSVRRERHAATRSSNTWPKDKTQGFVHTSKARQRRDNLTVEQVSPQGDPLGLAYGFLVEGALDWRMVSTTSVDRPEAKSCAPSGATLKVSIAPGL